MREEGEEWGRGSWQDGRRRMRELGGREVCLCKNHSMAARHERSARRREGRPANLAQSFPVRPRLGLAPIAHPWATSSITLAKVGKDCFWVGKVRQHENVKTEER